MFIVQVYSIYSFSLQVVQFFTAKYCFPLDQICSVPIVDWQSNFYDRLRLNSVRQEVSSMLLDKLLAAGVGKRPLVFVSHRYVRVSHVLNLVEVIIFMLYPFFFGFYHT